MTRSEDFGFWLKKRLLKIVVTFNISVALLKIVGVMLF